MEGWVWRGGVVAVEGWVWRGVVEGVEGWVWRGGVEGGEGSSLPARENRCMVHRNLRTGCQGEP